MSFEQEHGVSEKKHHVAKKMSQVSRLSRITNPEHSKGLSDSEYENGMRKYEAQRRRRKH